MTISIAERKNGVIQLNESCEQLMNSFVADLMDLKLRDSETTSRDLKVRLLADSSGNWELQLLTDWGFLPSKTVHL